jgi:3-methylcrotonyl-CoA carboxylase alpha subunit
MLAKLLIANRGEIACRIARTARRLGIATVAVYSDADARAAHVAACDEAVHIGPSPSIESYLVIDKIIEAARQTGADAIHPGYGFLSENDAFADACEAAGLIFVGPTGTAMRALGGKAAAKEIAISAGVPVVPGYQGADQTVKTLTREARRIGYPVMIKAVAGGGGRGMRLVPDAAELPELLDSARREAQSAFGNPAVLIEKVVQAPRHVEVQVFGDTHGNVVHLFERDCSLQRRNQKVVEEAPAPGMSAQLRQEICTAAVKLARSVGYRGAGTVEFLVEGGTLGPKAPWYFIEMNTRLQVEHPVTEEITGLDLVEWQLRVAAGEPLPLSQDEIRMTGHAVEVRLCAEDPAEGFLPSIGRLLAMSAPADLPGIRLESGVRQGDEVSPFYDSMIAKLIAVAPTRDAAFDAVSAALRSAVVMGPRTNAGFLAALLDHADVRALRLDTGLIARALSGLVASGRDWTAAAHGTLALIETMRDAPSHGRAGSDPWGATDAFQLGGSRRLVLPVLVDGVASVATVDWVAGRPQISFKDASTPDTSPAATAPFHVRHDDGRVVVLHAARQTTIAPMRYDPAEADDGADGAVLRAPINGRVAKVFLAPGASVEKGERIAVVEAMKMEHLLVAGIAGTIERIAAAEGAQVTQGSVIAVITPKA